MMAEAFLTDVEQGKSEELYLGSDNKLSTSQLQRLGRALKTNTVLVKLNLAKNKIGDVGVGDVARALHDNGTLTGLNLAVNGIGPDGAKDIGGALRVNSTLKFLNLSHNQIGPNGAKDVADALRVNSTLTTLYFSSSGIRNAGAGYVARALEKNSTLLTLDLAFNAIGAFNPIGDIGAGDVARALKKNNTLLTLDLRNNKIGDVDARDILSALQSNKTLTKLYIGSNHISSQLNRGIETKIKQNKARAAARNDEVSQLLKDSLKEDKKEKWGRAKLMFVGEGKGGKTSTVRAMLKQPFVKDHLSTRVAEVHCCQAQAEAKTENARFQEEDMLENTLEQFLGKQMVSNKIAQDDAKQDHHRRSERNIQKQKRHDTSEETAEKDQPATAMQRRISRVSQRSVAAPEIDHANVIASASFFEGAKDPINFYIWDYGGQSVFYTLHHVFLTRSGIYCVVFNMTRLLTPDQAALDNIGFWLDSISLHAPDARIFLIGTHRDLCNKAAIKEVNKHLEELLAKRRKNSRTDKLVLPQGQSKQATSFFPLANNDRDDHGVQVLCKSIHAVAVDEPVTKLEVSVRWVALLDELLSREESEKTSLMDVKELAATQFGISESACMKMLDMFHKLGVLVHFKQFPEQVITKPQWLLNKLGLVIHDSKLHNLLKVSAENCSLNDLVELSQELKQSDLHCRAYERLCKYAEAEERLLKFLWGGSTKDFNFLVRVMDDLLLISKLPGKRSDLYLVPSMLNTLTNLPDLDKPSFTFDFSKCFLPQGIFERIVCICIDRLSKNSDSLFGDQQHASKLLFRGYAKFQLPDADFVIAENPDTKSKSSSMYPRIDLEIIDKSNDIVSVSAKYGLLLTAALNEIKTKFMGAKLSAKLFVHIEDNTELWAFEDVKKFLKLEANGAENRGPSRQKRAESNRNIELLLQTRNGKELAREHETLQSDFSLFFSFRGMSGHVDTLSHVTALAKDLEVIARKDLKKNDPQIFVANDKAGKISDIVFYLEHSDYHVIVLQEDYFESLWCVAEACLAFKREREGRGAVKIGVIYFKSEKENGGERVLQSIINGHRPEDENQWFAYQQMVKHLGEMQSYKQFNKICDEDIKACAMGFKDHIATKILTDEGFEFKRACIAKLLKRMDIKDTLFK